MNYENVAVLLCTYNGEAFIREQLDSIIAQDHRNWRIFVSDDGSTDNTLIIIKEYQKYLGKDKIELLSGPKKGFSWNFINLIESCGEGYSYYALSDQDDAWMPNKLSKSIQFLREISSEKPAVYCGRTALIDGEGKDIGYSPIFKKQASFRNALIQSIAGGNTMVFNNAARNIIKQTPKYFDIVSHDWWIYIIISGCGGVVNYDSEPTIKYRQHSANIVGSNISWSGRINRIFKLFDGHFRIWIQSNIDAMDAASLPLTQENRKIFEKFKIARQAPFIKRILIFTKLALYRQTFLGSIAFLFAILVKKI